MKWCIVADSSCDLKTLETHSSDIEFKSVPFVISIDGKDFVDSPEMDAFDMVDKMEASAKASTTACPSPQTWFDCFKDADYSFAITISANVSGSFNSATTAKQMIEEQFKDKKVFVLDSKSAGAVLTMYAEKLVELINKGLSFEEVVNEIEKYKSKRHTIFALASFSNLVKNGRVGKIAGFLARILKMWGIGINTKEGKIAVKKKTRGEKNVVNAFVEDMQQNGFDDDYVVISHCQNFELATKVKNTLLSIWKKLKIKIIPTRGLCSYYAERKGLILGYW